jgi:hypothetical protein
VGVESSPSLSVGLARAITSLGSAHADETGVRGSLAVWATVLQHLPGDGGGRVEVKAMPSLACLSKRAVTSASKFAARLGFVTIEDKALALTPAGVGAREEWTPAVDSPELRARLVPVVAQLPLEHPHFPTQYGTADSSLTGGPGQDWKPVPRRSGAVEVGALPLTSLLSQAFCAVAIAYERSNGALGWAANVCAVVPDEGCAMSSLPAGAAWVLGGMERHRWITRSSDGGGRVELTSIGRSVRDRHASVLASAERAIDPDGALASAVSAFVAARPDASALERVVHPPTTHAFGLQMGKG